MKEEISALLGFQSKKTSDSTSKTAHCKVVAASRGGRRGGTAGDPN